LIFKTKLIDKDKSYSFSDYCKMNDKLESIILFFDYKHQIEDNLFINIKPFEDKKLETYILMIMKKISMTSEFARREFLIAPIVIKLVEIFDNIDIDTEMNINYNNLLKGKLDYLLSTNNNFLIIEAKDENLQGGYKQLAIEMITLDKIFQDEKIERDFIYGAISTGNEWKFIILNRKTKTFLSDVKLYFLPDNLKEILGIFVNILKLKT
jgi:hypothetical protein